ncbi:opioid growth factor receptor-like [Xenentodon cancila]
MVWFTENPLYAALGWFWGRLKPIVRCCVKALIALPRVARRLPLPWRKDAGNETERNEENNQPVRSVVENVDETRGYDPHDESRASGCQGHDEVTGDGECRVETTDEFYCCYDSTWETEESHELPSLGRSTSPGYGYSKFSRFKSAAKDMQNYRHGYPNEKPNLSFYLGHTASVPDGVYISEFHDEWYGKYNKLEYVHTYIQWLFPLQEPGMNHEASTLTKEEIQDFLENSTAKENLLKSYKLMLDFYGVELVDERTGAVARADNWMERFNNLNSHTHNNLRITRILKCLGTLGYSHFQAPLVHFFLEQTLIKGQLPKVQDSVLNYFLFAVLDKGARRELLKFAYLHYGAAEEFVWCPKKVQMLWSRPSECKRRMNRKGVGGKDGYSSDESQDEEETTAPPALYPQ